MMERGKEPQYVTDVNSGRLGRRSSRTLNVKGRVMTRQVKCNKCGHVGPEDEFPHERDFFQNRFIASCPKCDNRQSIGDASMRMFGGERPFIFVDRNVEPKVTGDKPVDALPSVLHRASEAS